MKRLDKLFAAVLVVAFCFSGWAVSTKINLATQVKGILACGHGGTGAATVNAFEFLMGPTSGAASCPSFRAIDPLDTSAVRQPEVYRWSYAGCPNTATQVIGDSYTTIGGLSVGAGTDPFCYVRFTASSALNDQSALSGNIIYTTGRHLDDQDYGSLTVAAGNSGDNERFWMCLTDQTAVTMGGSDNPAGNYICFRYSSGAGDTTWHCVSKDNSTQENNSTGATFGTGRHLFELYEDVANSKWTCRIDGVDMVSNSTHIPATGTPLRYVDSITTTTAGLAHSYQVSFRFIKSDF